MPLPALPKLAPVVILCALCGCSENEAGGGPTSPSADAGEVGTGGASGASGSDAAADHDGGGVEGVALDALCASIHARVCGALTQCDCPFDARPYDASTCVSERTADCETRMQPTIEEVAAGRVAYSVENATRCLAWLDDLAASCARFDDDAMFASSGCRGMLTDASGLGEACLLGEDFAPCALGEGICTSTGGGVPTCGVLAAKGETCFGPFCQAGLACVDAVCDTPRSASQPCLQDEDCQQGLVCLASMQCGAPQSATGACEEWADCAEGLACDAGTCVSAAALGEACASPEECGAQRACAGLHAGNTCSNPLAQGDACEQDGSCGDGLVCDFDATHTCVEAPIAGLTCVNGAWCAEGFACDFMTSTCVTAPEAGEPCMVGPVQCAEGLGCDDTTTCVAAPGEGQPCLSGMVACAAGLGCGKDQVCHLPPGAGSPCLSDSGPNLCAPTAFCDFTDLACKSFYATGTPCSQGHECGPDAECSDRAMPGSYRCEPLTSASGGPCTSECGGGLYCAYAVAPGVCRPAACGSP